MRHDRTGEPIDDEDQAPAEHPDATPHTCDNGWIDHDADHPRPYPTCRPHLAARLSAARGHRTREHVPSQPGQEAYQG